MTQNDMMQKVVEAAGGKWHRVFNTKGRGECTCGETAYDCLKAGRTTNPSPDDLNALFRLAEKLGFNHVNHFIHSNACMIHKNEITEAITGIGDTPAEALLNVLYGSITT